MRQEIPPITPTIAADPKKLARWLSQLTDQISGEVAGIETRLGDVPSVEYLTETIQDTANESADASYEGLPFEVAYTHVQGVAASDWHIEHDLGYRPGGIVIIDTAGTTVEGDVEHIDENVLELHFTAPFTGNAYLS